MKKIKSQDEVDVIDLIISIWDKKKIILFATIIGILLGFIFESLNKNTPVYIVEGQIKPISVLENARYEIYNSYVSSLKPLDGKDDTIGGSYSSSEKKYVENFSKNILQTNVVYNLELSDINKEFLFSLFVDKITQKKNLENYMRQFKLIEGNINKEKKLTKAILEISASIKKTQVNNVGRNSEVEPIKIKFETYNRNQTKNFLEFLEKEINLDIQKNLMSMFNNYLMFIKSMNSFQLEDIESQLLINSDQEKLKSLKDKKKILLSDKYIQRITDIFKKSPVSESINFYAAKIVVESDDLGSPKTPMKKILVIFGIIGLILGVITALISKAMELRKVS